MTISEPFCKTNMSPKLYVRGFKQQISFQKQLGSLVFKNKNCNWSFSIFVKFPCPRFDQLDNDGPLSVMAAREVGGGRWHSSLFKFYSQRRSSVPRKIPLFEGWIRKKLQISVSSMLVVVLALCRGCLVMIIITIKRPLRRKTCEWQYQNLFVKQICLPSFMLDGSNNKNKLSKAVRLSSFQKQEL